MRRPVTPSHSPPRSCPSSRPSAKKIQYPEELVPGQPTSSTARYRTNMTPSKQTPPSYARQTQSSQARGPGQCHPTGRGLGNGGRRAVSAAVVAPTRSSPNGKFHNTFPGFAPTFPLKAQASLGGRQAGSFLSLFFPSSLLMHRLRRSLDPGALFPCGWTQNRDPNDHSWLGCLLAGCLRTG